MFPKIKNNGNLVCLISPLDWGLGHTTRIFPVIQEQLDKGNKVIIACNSIQKEIYKENFTGVGFVSLPGYRIKYGRNSWQTILGLVFQIPKILIQIKSEYTWLKGFLANNQVDLIISDNRYGFRNKSVYSVLITHQLAPKTGLGKLADSFMQWAITSYINKFNLCIVPDYDKEKSLAGELSHPKKTPSTPVKYAGMFSRFTTIVPKWNASPVPDKFLLFILSGPEPQRSIFENIILKEIKNSGWKAILVRGKPSSDNLDMQEDKNITLYNHLPSAALAFLIQKATVVISRSGYTTIMDMEVLKKPFLMVPTPGQPEQEYLAAYLSEKYNSMYIKQQYFSIKAINKIYEQMPTEKSAITN